VALLIVAATTLAVALPFGQAVAQPRPRHDTRTHAPQHTATATTGDMPNAMQGFSKNRHEPIQIEANSLEVQDKSKVATFRGGVRVKQGDTGMRCNTLVVFYEGDGASATSASLSVSPGSDTQRIRRLEAKGHVVVTQKDQTASGETGVFDMRKNTITLQGNVVVSQGRNILRGERLVVDMATGTSRMESGHGRVQGLFQPSTQNEGARRGSPSITPPLR
jgi:lipopolysaccharide export system protein LptA